MVVVCLPRLFLSESVLVLMLSSLSNRLINVDLPTPDCPSNKEDSFFRILKRPVLFVLAFAETIVIEYQFIQ